MYASIFPNLPTRAGVYSARPAPPIPRRRITRAAPTTRAKAGLPQVRSKLWGRLPVEAIEGHEPEPAWDVAGDGLGYGPMEIFFPDPATKLGGDIRPVSEGQPTPTPGWVFPPMATYGGWLLPIGAGILLALFMRR